MENAIFKDIRDPYLEQPAQQLLNLKLFEPHCFDYSTGKFSKLQQYDLYKMLSQEIKEFKQFQASNQSVIVKSKFNGRGPWPNLTHRYV
jgi:hypothetical protein